VEFQRRKELKNLALIFLFAGSLLGQYVIGDRRYEGRQDMSPAAAWIPPIVTSDPVGPCVPVNRVVMSSASGGLFRCGGGGWATITAGGGGGSALPCAVTVAANVATVAACSWRNGDVPLSAASATATVTAAVATGTLRIWADGTGAIFAGHDVTTVTCSGCTVVPASTGFPAGAVWIASVPVAIGGTLGTITDHRRELASTGLAASTTIGINRDLSTGNAQPFLLSPPVANHTTAGAGYVAATPIEGLSVNGQDTFVATTSAPFYSQFRVQSGITVRNIRIFISALAASGTAGMTFGIYDSTCAKLGQTTSQILNGATGVTTFAMAAALDLTPGVYYLGYASETAGTGFAQLNMPSALTQMLNQTSLARVFTGSTVATGTGASLATPASCGTRTAVGTYPIYAFLVP
jgi:hypothetical protein